MSTIILHSLLHYFHVLLDCVLCSFCYVDSWRWRCLCLSLGCVWFHICVDLCVSDSFLWLVVVVCLYSILLNLCNTCACSTVIPAMVQHFFFAIITQRDHKYATPPPWKQFYVFLVLTTAPTGVLTAGTAGLLWKANLKERCCTFMEKRRRCNIAGITELLNDF